MKQKNQNPKQYFKILNSEEKSEILKLLEKQFGITQLQGSLIKKGAERIFLYTGTLTEKQIFRLEKRINIERLGVYFGKIIENKKTQTKEIRLSIEGTQLLKEKVKKNIYNIPDNETLEKWMKGQELNFEDDHGLRGFVFIKYNEEFLGTGKASEKKISNFIPKNRRLKDKEIY